MGKRKKTDPRRELAAKRVQAGYSQAKFAAAIDASLNAVRGWEQGLSQPMPRYRQPMARVLGVSLAEVDRLIGGRPSDLNGHALDAAPVGAAGLNLFVKAEQSATQCAIYDLAALPALCQTATYATALERVYWRGALSKSEIAERVDLRMARAAVLERQPDPLELAVRIPWHVLHQPRGDAMVDQLTHLLAMAERPNVDLRIVPIASEAPYALASFAMLTTTGSVTPDFVAEERAGSMAYTDEAATLARLGALFDDLTNCALSTRETTDYIHKTKENYR